MSNKLNFRFLAEPTDVNFGGHVHGGSVMKWIDQAAYACASTWSDRYCVTVYVGGVQFLKPIKIGEIVEVQTKVIYTGNSSIHIAVDLYARDPKKVEKRKTTHCICVFVAVDEKGNPTKVKEWVPQSEQEKRMEDYAKRLMEQRRNIQEEMKPYLEE